MLPTDSADEPYVGDAELGALELLSHYGRRNGVQAYVVVFLGIGLVWFPDFWKFSEQLADSHHLILRSSYGTPVISSTRYLVLSFAS